MAAVKSCHFLIKLKSMNTRKTIPAKTGIGLRSKHHKEILQTKPNISWFEVHTENYFADGGITIEFLEKISSIYPISFHGVSLSLGSADGLNKNYLAKLKSLIDRFNPGLVSEHLSWTSYNGIYTHDLLPIPYNKKTLESFCNHVDYVQNFIGREISIENPSSYLKFKNSTIREDDFLNQLAEKTSCGILLDVNNIYVSSQNNKFDPLKYHVEKKHVREIHLAGHTKITTNSGIEMCIDTHDDFVSQKVWELYEHTIKYIGAVPTLIEWDKNLPELEILLKEAEKAQKILDLYNNEHINKDLTEAVS